MSTYARPKSQFGRLAALCSGHHLATLSAQRVVEQGGSLVDAMLAASAMLAVALPHAGGLGGCGMMLYYDAASGTVHALNGSGRAPAATPAQQLAEQGAMPQAGVGAAVTPTLVRLWARAHERFGRLPWNSLLAPAIAAADSGLGTAEELAHTLATADPHLHTQPGFKESFMRQGKLLVPGQPLRQPRLSEVLQAIARHGEKGFFTGWVARSLADFSTEHGGWLTQDDLARAQADWCDSWHTHYAGRQVHVMPPNSAGVLMLRQLNLRATALAAGSADGTAADVLRAQAVLRHYLPLLGDPARKRLLPSDFELGERHIRGDEGSTAPVLDAGAGDTTGFVAMDVAGNAVALLQSVFHPLGSGCVDPGTGVLLNNRMFSFTAQAGRANSVQPLARPAHTLNPYLVLGGKRVELAAVSPGGLSQTTTGLQFASAALDTSETLGALVARPRWSLAPGGGVLLEPGMAAEVAETLRARGLAVQDEAVDALHFGSVKAVRASPLGGLEAAADGRRQAHAAAW